MIRYRLPSRRVLFSLKKRNHGIEEINPDSENYVSLQIAFNPVAPTWS